MKTWNPGNGGLNARGNWKFLLVVQWLGLNAFTRPWPRLRIPGRGTIILKGTDIILPRGKLNSGTSQGHGGGGKFQTAATERTEPPGRKMKWKVLWQTLYVEGEKNITEHLDCMERLRYMWGGGETRVNEYSQWKQINCSWEGNYSEQYSRD